MVGHSSLNHVYRTVWNEALGAMVAVAEHAANHGGQPRSVVRGRATAAGKVPAGALTPLALVVALVCCGAVVPVRANPQGGVAIHGQATFDASQPSLLRVTTQNGAGTNHSAINWQSFSIPAGSTTQIVQPSATSMSINRVVTNTPSVLFGSLQSNGQVVLVNQAGIAVGSGAMVDTAGFTASAVGLSAADAVLGRLRFAGDGFSNTSGALTVQGNIIARGGDVVLIAPSVEVAQTAVVEAQGGSVLLAAGQSVEVTGRGLEGITLQVQAPADQALNLGSLKGDAVGIFAGTLKHSGVIQATTASLEGGKVVLKAAGDAYVQGNGRIDAVSTTGKGGSIEVLGNRVAVTDSAVLDASGATGGGVVLVGGDYQGKNPDIQNAGVTYFAANATLKADATDRGDGGKVILWADDTTRAYGHISATGGVNGGNGGFVETSGKNHLDVGRIGVNTGAQAGLVGTWLLDPTDIYIAVDQATAAAAGMSGTDLSIDSSGPFTFVVAGTPSASLLLTGTLQTALASNNVVVNTASGSGSAGNITVNSALTWTSNKSLTLNANAGISVKNTVTGLNGTLSLVSGSSIDNNSGGGLIHVNKVEATASGSINLVGNNQISNLAASSTGASVSVEAAASGGLTIGSVGSTNGVSAYAGVTIKQYTAGGITVDKNVTSTMAGNVSLGVASGTGGIALGNAAAVTLLGSSGVVLYTSGGAITQTNALTVTGPLTMTTNSTSGGITLANAANDFTGTVTIDPAGAGAVTLVDANALALGAMPISGPLNVTAGNGLTVGGAITTSAGDISLTASGLNKLLTIGSAVQATNGNVSYVADNVSLTAGTTSSTAAGRFVEIKPYTAATTIQLVGLGDIAGTLRLSNTEINQITTPLFKLGNTAVTGNILVDQSFAPTNFTAASFITSGAITQSAGGITISKLNADGLGGVSLTGSNAVTTLAGHTNTGNFSFTNSGSLSLGAVDIRTGVVSDGGGTITLNTGSTLTLGAVLKTSGAVSLTSTGGAIVDGDGIATNIFAGSTTLSASSGIGVGDAIEIKTSSLSASNSTSNDIVLDVSGPVTLGTMTPASGARWLVYAATNTDVVPGSVVANFTRYGATYATYPSPTETGNGFLFASAPAGATSPANLVATYQDMFEPPLLTSLPAAEEKDKARDAIVVEGEVCKP